MVTIQNKIVFLVTLILLVGCVEVKEQQETITYEKVKSENKEVVDMGKVLLIIASNKFRDEEFAHPKEALLNAGYTVEIASSTTNTVTGMLGMRVTPDMTLDEALEKISDYEAVVFIGGQGAQEYFDDSTAHNIAKTAVSQGKIVGAICIAPVILANAGVLEGKQATVWDGEFVAKLEEKGATYTGDDVTVDGNIVTGNGPNAAKQFGQQIVQLLNK